MAHLRVHRANGVNLSQIHIGQSTKKEKLIISESLPQQALASLSTAVGSSFETLGNIPSLSRAAQGWGPLLRRIANAAFDF